MPLTSGASGTTGAATIVEAWLRVDDTETFGRFRRCFASVSGWLVERGQVNVLFLVRPSRAAAGCFAGHVVGMTVTTQGRERLRFEPCGSFTVRRGGKIDLDLVGPLSGLIASRLEDAEKPGAPVVPRHIFLGKLKASEAEFERYR